MSGVEVAGLLIGLLPLVITALEHYQDVHKARGLVARFESEYKRTLRDVKHEQLVLHLTLKDLLAPLCGDDEFVEGDLEKWLSDPDHSEWRAEEVKSIMKERLGSDVLYEHFLEITDALHQTASKLLITLVDKKPKLQAKLEAGLKTQTATPAPAKTKLSMTAFQTFAKDQMAYRGEQLKYGLSKPQREDLIAQMRGDNQKLRDLLEQSEKVASLKASKAPTVYSRALKAMLQYWRHADRIYTLVSQSWECACQKKHHAHLWLQHRESSMFEFTFLVLFDPGIHPKHTLPPWDRQGLRVTQCRLEKRRRAAETGKTASKVQVALGKSSQSLTTATIPAKPTPKVRFSVGSAGLPSDGDSASATKDQSHPGNDGQSTPTAISKLCDIMSTCDMRDDFVGSLKATEASYSVHSDTSQKLAVDSISLHSILGGMRKKRPSRAVRFGIALAVASAHLQLKSTAWARRQWQAQDILFPRDVGSDAVMLDRPYVSADFDGPASVTANPPRQNDRSFASLGIMLMELAFGLTLEGHELWHNAGFGGNEDAPLYRTMVAKVWADTLEGEVDPGYSEAVAWCLNESPMALDGEAWRKELANRVVLPLQASCEHIGARKYVGARS